MDSIGAARREVRTCEHDDRPARAIVIERSYDTTVADVWDAVTNRERIPRRGATRGPGRDRRRELG